jgi:hypothetical protein
VDALGEARSNGPFDGRIVILIFSRSPSAT